MKEEIKNEDEEKKKLVDVGCAKQVEISNDIKDHLLQMRIKNILKKFEHEFSTQWKTEQLQLVRLFEIELNGCDPFFIEG